ncbi:hypothetical protein CLAFUW4_05787 [Fulvia fulva]|uniref:CENP-V/GFA domain-containing protein n=1 Tax=Passalora fulva TaxID=5499 RepID=A0A9Q8P8U0_PASFU|nr:uncharacterized protein CLAFUR5_05928 [Fulvia fulva]KAK4624604.1 hypothetical protein CLAFUR4_05781 [Fulvia fulva]KAK4624796.1 hypothetical protein CLAFUR0_05792 [Fulvia fulva]UJO17580.1 hypothetical protein CLAFUR5_05928 [Fulvia fulva]WPV15466.1 hypothetical protein CLAFUW4_05787 [Fulvia fulva]WPV29608.1 hypothetical protein CLAFUW7_05785 [Fulvia fulva]
MASGSCMCGAVGYKYEGEPAVTALCHCIDCQKWTGAAYTSNVVVPRTSFKVTKGQPKDYDAVGASGKINKHWFCSNCGSSLYTELEVMPDMTCVKSGGLDGGAADHKIGVEFYTKDRLAYSAPVAGADQKPEFS